MLAASQSPSDAPRIDLLGVGAIALPQLKEDGSGGLLEGSERKALILGEV